MAQSTNKSNFSGSWTCRHWYPNKKQDGEDVDEHEAEMKQAGNELIFESDKGTHQSYMFVRMIIDDDLATGTWHETTDPDGFYKGATYSGSFQLIINRDKNIMDGMWVGSGNDRGKLKIYSGRIQFERK